jgi:hypothetical protein
MPDHTLEPSWEIWTAIADSVAESFVASTLYEHRYNIKHRCFNMAEVFSKLSDHKHANQLLIISDDLYDFDLGAIERLKTYGISTLLLPATELAGDGELRNSPVALLRKIREVNKSPSLAEPTPHLSPNPHCTIVALLSHSGGVGTTNLAINLAMELSILGKRTLLIDGDRCHPTISEQLQLRNYVSENHPQPLKENLHFLESLQPLISTCLPTLQRAVNTYQYLVIDLGQWNVEQPTSLQDFALDFADRVVIVSTNSQIHRKRSKKVVSDLKLRGIHGTPHLVINLVRGKVGSGELPCEERLFSQAQQRGLVAVEVNPRSRWRKEVERIAIQLIS